MGVTLERVQNKFACIIGELCSEPIVLSQFAVWVDLRISEYKTNGTISLDCSGESPNPSWMKGVKNQAVRNSSNSVDTGQGGHCRRSSYANSPNVEMSPSASPLSNQMYNERLQSSESPHHSNSNTQNFSCRLSPDILVIKDEEDSDQPSSCALSRKRPSEADSEFLSPGKSRRHGNETYASSAQESSSNQSLMSIINTENDSVSLEPVESDNDIFKVTMEMQEDLHKGQGLSQANSSTFSPRRPSATATSSSNSPVQSAWPTSYPSSDPQQASSSQAGSKTELFVGVHGSHISPNPNSELLKISKPVPVLYQGEDHKNNVQLRKKRIVNIHEKSNTTIKHLIAAFGIVEWWLRENYHEQRKVEDIPPVELDEYLADFFTHGKKINGMDFGASYFSRLRTSLERHLKEHEYPHSIVKSELFVKSQTAFKNRYQNLRLKMQFMSSPGLGSYEETFASPE